MKAYAACIALACLGWWPGQAGAANIAVTNIVLRDWDAARNTAVVQFDVKWDHSWRTATPSNWDAAWLFVKYHVQGATGWQHACLGTNDSDHIGPTGSVIQVGLTDDKGMGVFLYRSSMGEIETLFRTLPKYNETGTVEFKQVQLLWKRDGGAPAAPDGVEVNVHALEMVYIPQGRFYCGDGASGKDAGAGELTAGLSALPGEITNEGALKLGGPDADLGNHDSATCYPPDDFTSKTQRRLPAAYPKGFEAFYCMKYFITQGQYADFLSELTPEQCKTRDAKAYKTMNYTIHGTPGGNYVADRRERPVNCFSWSDGTAYVDWAGLRHMTELEYEKIGRGFGFPIANEYAWGTTWFKGFEWPPVVVTRLGPMWNSIYDKPAPRSIRETSGASYFGVMELTSAIWDRPISLGNAEGRRYTGQHGDGKLNAKGNANVPDWPDSVYGRGSALRGGGFTADPSWSPLSMRANGAYEESGRAFDCSLRGVRTAPGVIRPVRASKIDADKDESSPPPVTGSKTSRPPPVRQKLNKPEKPGGNETE
jgi:formylglycine-generating enzyme required for sulfatase activity